MSDTSFSAGTVVPSTWLNDVNDFTYKSWFVNASAFGALNDGTTDNTAAVQLALDSLGTPGGTVQVSPNTKFNLQSLVFPQRSNLEFRMDDDLSRPNPSTTLGTNERVMFMANANASGIVNEIQMTAAFHPGLVIDVRRDVAGHDAFLGAGQDRVPTVDEPARASINFADQQIGVYRTIYQAYGGTTYSVFAGTYSNGWRNTVTITGVGTGAGGFVSLPAVGDLVTGSVSGAKGWFLSATTTTTTLLWDSGRFAAGDRLIDSSETTVNTASSVAFAIDDFQTFGQDSRKGNWSFGLPVGVGDELVNVGGRMALLPSRDFGQYRHKTIAHPGLLFADLVTDVPTNGFVVHYDTTAAAASRRLTVRRISGATEETTDAAHLNACRAHCNFGNAGFASPSGTSSFGIASVTRTGTGRYDIVFSRAMERNDYSVSISLEEASIKGGYPLSKTTAGFTLAVATLGGTTAVDLAAAVSVVVHGGDI